MSYPYPNPDPFPARGTPEGEALWAKRERIPGSISVPYRHPSEQTRDWIKAEGYREAYEKLRLTWIAETDYDQGRMAMLDELLALAEELEKS